jgi:hypothetical protein
MLQELLPVLQAEMQELSRLKADIFQSNLSVHRLLSRVDLSGVDISALKAAREDVVRLYALWADASAALGGRKEAELRQRLADNIGGHQRAMSHSSESLRKEIDGESLEAADISGQNVTTKAKGPRRRRRRKPRPTQRSFVARSFDSPCPEDSGYSETASRNDNVEACGGGRRLQTAEALVEVGAEMPKKKAAVNTGGGGGGVGVTAGWLGRVGRASLYSCLLAAALLPLAMYQAQPPQCCEFMYPAPHWIHFQYVNGPPPI